MAKKNIPYDQKYYDPEIECMPRPELEQMQLERLQEMVQYAYDNTVYYKRSFDEAGVAPSDIKTLKDLEKFPFIDKKTERETQHVGTFFGEMCSVPEEDVIFMATSSGSTGVPTVSPFTQEDFDLWQDTEARLFWQAGMRPTDRYVHGLNFALYVGGPDVIGAQRLGALAIWVGAVPSDRLIFVLQQYQPTVIWTSPSYAWTSARRSRRRASTRVRLLYPHHHRGRRAGRLHSEHPRGHRGPVGREGGRLLRALRHLCACAAMRGEGRPAHRGGPDPRGNGGSGHGQVLAPGERASWCTPRS
ncbi:MAG: phenylacetate--CoA ligase family protein [Adlercreutzia equolifaciens]